MSYIAYFCFLVLLRLHILLFSFSSVNRGSFIYPALTVVIEHSLDQVFPIFFIQRTLEFACAHSLVMKLDKAMTEDNVIYSQVWVQDEYNFAYCGGE